MYVCMYVRALIACWYCRHELLPERDEISVGHYRLRKFKRSNVEVALLLTCI